MDFQNIPIRTISMAEESLPNYFIHKSWVEHTNRYLKDCRKSNFQLFNQEQFKSVFRNAPAAVLIINNLDNTYEFMSDNIRNIIGHTSADFMKGQMAFGISLVLPEHALILKEYLFPTLFQELEEGKRNKDVMKYRFAFNFKMRRKDGQYIWVQEQMTVLEEDENHNPILCTYFLSDIQKNKIDNRLDFSVFKIGDDGYYKNVRTTTFPPVEWLEISDREYEILQLIAVGNSSQKIADELNISVHTVNTHRRNMLEKTKAKNVAELLKIASAKGILMY